MTKVNFIRIIAMGTSTLLECMCQKCVHPKLFTVILGGYQFRGKNNEAFAD